MQLDLGTYKLKIQILKKLNMYVNLKMADHDQCSSSLVCLSKQWMGSCVYNNEFSGVSVAVASFRI